MGLKVLISVLSYVNEEIKTYTYVTLMIDQRFRYVFASKGTQAVYFNPNLQ